jgi:hypothetical protein
VLTGDFGLLPVGLDPAEETGFRVDDYPAVTGRYVVDVDIARPLG